MAPFGAVRLAGRRSRRRGVTSRPRAGARPRACSLSPDRPNTLGRAACIDAADSDTRARPGRACAIPVLTACARSGQRPATTEGTQHEHPAHSDSDSPKAAQRSDTGCARSYGRWRHAGMRSVPGLRWHGTARTGAVAPHSMSTPARSVRVPDALWRAAMRAAADDGRTLTDVIVSALLDYVRKSRKEK